LKQILRGELGFDGAIFSDDLSMEAAAGVGDFMDRAQLAQQAGCDMLLVCNNPAAAEQVLDRLPVSQNSDRDRRLQAMRGHGQFNRQALFKSEQWQQVSAQNKQLTETHA
jgi:beta-N-acetylhexosaminidase